MASKFINETLKDNILQLDELSDSILTEINTLTNLDIDEVNEDQVNLKIVQNSFKNVNNLVLALKQGKVSHHRRGSFSSGGGNGDGITQSSVGLDELLEILAPFKDQGFLPIDGSGADGFSTVKEFERLQSLIILYSIVVLYQHLLTTNLNTSIPLNESYYYYDLILNSSWRTGLYSLQTLPERLFKLTGNVIQEIKDTNALNIESSKEDEEEDSNNNTSIQLFVNKVKFYAKVIFKSLYNNVITNNLQGFYKFSINSFRFNNVGIKSLKHPRFDSHTNLFDGFINVKNYISLIVGIPFSSIHEELKSIKNSIGERQLKSSKILGYLISNIPDFNELIKSPSKIQKFLIDLNFELNDDDQDKPPIQGILTNDTTTSTTTTTTSNDNSIHPFTLLYELTSKLNTQPKSKPTLSKPSFITRYWPTILITLLYGPKAINKTIKNRELILNFIKEKLIGTIIKFYENWILKPLNDIFNTIRHDSNSEISIMSQNSLNSDLESLKRMVIDYTLDSKNGLNINEQKEIKLKMDELISNGDLTPFMENYESEIKTPIKSIIKGNLTRGLLIQLQKTKVDGSVAINGIDKLLKSQQLVFGVIAASPSLLIVFYLSNLISSYLNYGYLIRDATIKKLIISKNLNNIERLLIKLKSIDNNNIDEINTINGYLLIEIFSLRKNGIEIIVKNRKFEWIRDVNDLIYQNGKTVEFRLDTVNRMYHVYGRYL